MFKVKWKLSLQKDVSGIMVAVKTNFIATDRRWSGSLGNKQENTQNILSIFSQCIDFRYGFKLNAGQISVRVSLAIKIQNCEIQIDKNYRQGVGVETY